MSDVIVKIRKARPNVPDPVYATAGAAGCDVCASEDVVIVPHTQRLLHTGLFLEVPSGYECQVRSRSGMSVKYGVAVLNSPGTLDCFAYDSVISTENGRLCVSEMHIDDIVFSFNEDTMEIERDVVSAIVDVGELDVMTLIMDDGTALSVTLNTFVYTSDGPKRAADLHEGDEILVNHDISIDVEADYRGKVLDMWP